MIISPILTMFQTKSSKDGLLVFLGNILNAGLNFTALVLLARTLGPEQYGLFTTASAALLLAAELSDLGINAGLIRFSSEYLQLGELQKAQQVFVLAIRARIKITLITVAIGLFLIQPAATFGFKEPLLIPLLYLSVLGIPPLVVHSFFSAVFQGYQRFNHHIFASIASGATKLILVLLLLWLNAVSYTHLTLPTKRIV